MSIKFIIKKQVIDRVKQFGFIAAFRQIGRAVVRSVYLKNEDIVVAAPDHKPEGHNIKSICDLTRDLINDRGPQWGLPDKDLNKMRSFLNNGCRGFISEQNGKLAALAFVQFSGLYHFGRDGEFLIPPGMAVLKNLYVYSQFRGSSIGKDMNMKRLSAIPEGTTPLGFVIPENRYAIRNLKAFGFIEILKVRRITWLLRFTKQKIYIIQDSPLARQVIGGLTNI